MSVEIEISWDLTTSSRSHCTETNPSLKRSRLLTSSSFTDDFLYLHSRHRNWLRTELAIVLWLLLFALTGTLFGWLRSPARQASVFVLSVELFLDSLWACNTCSWYADHDILFKVSHWTFGEPVLHSFRGLLSSLFLLQLFFSIQEGGHIRRGRDIAVIIDEMK